MFRSILQFLFNERVERAAALVAESEPPGAYTAVLFREAGPKGRFLLQKRIRRDKLYFGRIAMFGGHREGDETPEECAIREIEEETGVRLGHGELARVAAIKTFDNKGDVAVGHLFIVDDFDPERLDRRRISEEGRLVRLRENDFARNFRRFTPITALALQLYFDYRELQAGE